MPSSEPSSGINDLALLRQAAQHGRPEALNEVLGKHRDSLRRMVRVRMNDRLQGRLDASDIIQETFVEATRAMESYLNNPTLPVHLWLRHLAGQKLIQAHRTHLGAQKRDAGREQHLCGGAPMASSISLAGELAAEITSPSQAVMRQEARDELITALESMDAFDREVLTLRHFEQLTSAEAARILDASVDAIKKRYLRALEKLHKILAHPESE